MAKRIAVKKPAPKRTVKVHTTEETRTKRITRASLSPEELRTRYMAAENEEERTQIIGLITESNIADYVDAEQAQKKRVEDAKALFAENTAGALTKLKKAEEKYKAETAEAEAQLAKVVADVGAKTKGFSALIKEGMRFLNIKKIITPNKFLVSAKAGRAARVFTVAPTELITILRGENKAKDEIDGCFSISVTKVEALLGKTVMDRITKTEKDEFKTITVTKVD